MMAGLEERLFRVADVVFLPFVYPAAWLLRTVRRAGVQRLPRCRIALLKIGVFPIHRHYYEPQFDHRFPKRDYSEDRNLPGID